MKCKHNWEHDRTEDTGKGRVRATVVQHRCKRPGCLALMRTTLVFDDMNVTVPSVTVEEPGRVETRTSMEGSMSSSGLKTNSRPLPAGARLQGL